MNLISFAESQRIIREWCDSIRATTEKVPTRQVLNRVLAAAVHAVQSNPLTRVAAMDGIAVDFRSVTQFPTRLKSDRWIRINTGEPVPEQYNAVIKIEDVKWDGQVAVLDQRVDFYQNVRPAAEDFHANSLLLNSEHMLYPPDLSLLLTAGCEEVEVYRQPVVSFIPTGSELTLHADAHKVIESNSAMVAGMVNSWGGIFELQDLIPDDADDLAQMMKLCSTNSDILVISAGTSKGTHDITSDVLRLMGKVHFHGVAMSPAKPVLFGEIDGAPVLGLPGYPAAAYIGSQFFLRHLVCSFSHRKPATLQSVLISAEELPPRDIDYFHRVNAFEVDGQTFVRRIPRGAGSIFSLAQMDGWMHVPPGIAIHKRDAVRIDMVQERSTNTIVAKGILDSGLLRIFDLLSVTMPGHRVLFWESEPAEALQNIIERSLHIAAIETPSDESGPFATFAKQLQERMCCYRAFTRTIGLILSNQEAASRDLTPGLRIAMPEKNQMLWHPFLEKNQIVDPQFLLIPTASPESALVDAIETNLWDAAFVDIRFLKPGQAHLGELKVHVELVIPDSYRDLPAIKKLIELLLSDEYAMWVETQSGCDVASRGLLADI